jgi:hypothetical protein
MPRSAALFDGLSLGLEGTDAVILHSVPFAGQTRDSLVKNPGGPASDPHGPLPWVRYLFTSLRPYLDSATLFLDTCHDS